MAVNTGFKHSKIELNNLPYQRRASLREKAEPPRSFACVPLNMQRSTNSAVDCDLFPDVR